MKVEKVWAVDLKRHISSILLTLRLVWQLLGPRRPHTAPTSTFTASIYFRVKLQKFLLLDSCLLLKRSEPVGSGNFGVICDIVHQVVPCSGRFDSSTVIGRRRTTYGLSAFGSPAKETVGNLIRTFICRIHLKLYQTPSFSNSVASIPPLYISEFSSRTAKKEGCCPSDSTCLFQSRPRNWSTTCRTERRYASIIA